MTPTTFQAPEGQGWTRRTVRGKWHLVVAPGAEYRCRRQGSPRPFFDDETLAARIGPGGRGRVGVCRYCLGLAGYDPDTGERWTQP